MGPVRPRPAFRKVRLHLWPPWMRGKRRYCPGRRVAAPQAGAQDKRAARRGAGRARRAARPPSHRRASARREPTPLRRRQATQQPMRAQFVRPAVRASFVRPTMRASRVRRTMRPAFAIPSVQRAVVRASFAVGFWVHIRHAFARAQRPVSARSHELLVPRYRAKARRGSVRARTDSARALQSNALHAADVVRPLQALLALAVRRSTGRDAVVVVDSCRNS